MTWLIWWNTTVNGPANAVSTPWLIHILPRGVLYFKNDLRFQCTTVNVIALTTIITARPSQQIFREVANSQQNYVQMSYTEFQTNGTINVETADRKSLTLRNEVWLSVRQLVLSCPSLNKFLWKSPVSNYSNMIKSVENMANFH